MSADHVPEASGLLARRVGDDLVVVDQETGTAHCLAGESAAAYLAAAGPSRRALLRRAGLLAGGTLASTLLLPEALAHATAPTLHVITMKSTAAQGATDPLVKVSTTAATGPYNFAVGHTNNGWVPLTGTAFVNADGSDNGLAQSYWFQAAFTLPTGYSTPSVSVQAEGDDSVKSFLNDSTFNTSGSHYLGAGGTYNSGATSPTVSSNNAALFLTGANLLNFLVVNTGGPYGLDFTATVNYYK